MASTAWSNILAFKAAAAIAKGKAVKIGADNKHVAVCSAATDKSVGIMQSVPDAAEATCEVAMPGGGAKALCSTTVSAGDLLAPAAGGDLAPTTNANDRVIALALEDGVAGDLISVMVIVSNY